eukprot:2235374-Rhodomonas_salina.1
MCCGIRPKEKDYSMDPLDSERVRQNIQMEIARENPALPGDEVEQACDLVRKEHTDPLEAERKLEKERQVNATRSARYRKR